MESSDSASSCLKILPPDMIPVDSDQWRYAISQIFFYIPLRRRRGAAETALREADLHVEINQRDHLRIYDRAVMLSESGAMQLDNDAPERA